MDAMRITEFKLQYTAGLTSEPKRICKQNICCEFNLKYNYLKLTNDDIGYTYRLTVFSGIRSYGDRVGGEVYCAIVTCTDDDHSTCGKRFKSSKNLKPSVEFTEIDIRMTVKEYNRDYLVMPNSLDFSILPFDSGKFNFNEEKSNEIDPKAIYRITSNNVTLDNFLTFGIFGRNFNLDDSVESSAGSIFTAIIHSNTLVFIVMIITGWLSYVYI